MALPLGLPLPHSVLLWLRLRLLLLFYFIPFAAVVLRPSLHPPLAPSPPPLPDSFGCLARSLSLLSMCRQQFLWYICFIALAFLPPIQPCVVPPPPCSLLLGSVCVWQAGAWCFFFAYITRVDTMCLPLLPASSSSTRPSSAHLLSHI